MDSPKVHQDVKAHINNWIVDISIRFPEELPVYYQIIDSMYWHYIGSGIFPQAGDFDFGEDLQQQAFAEHIGSYFRPLNTGESVLEFRSLGLRRPPGTPLPPLSIRQHGVGPPTAHDALAQHMQQKDNIWRGLVNDRARAHEIIGEYEKLEDDKAKIIGQTYQATHQLPDIADDEQLKSILSNPALSQPYVRQLFESMVNFTDTIDRQQKVRKGKGKANDNDEPDEFQDAVAVTRVKNAPNIVLEAMAWIILEAAIEAQRGNIHTSPWHKVMGKQLYEAYATLDDRLAKINEALKQSKALVDNLMATVMVRRLAAVPGDMLHRKNANKVTNTKRDLQVKVGSIVLRAEAAGSGTAVASRSGTASPRHGAASASRRSSASAYRQRSASPSRHSTASAFRQRSASPSRPGTGSAVRQALSSRANYELDDHELYGIDE